MLQIKTSARRPMQARLYRSQHVLPALDQFVRTRASALLRLLILVLVGLLFVFVGLLLATGRADVGVPIIGGVLFTGFAAAQLGRDPGSD